MPHLSWISQSFTVTNFYGKKVCWQCFLQAFWQSRSDTTTDSTLILNPVSLDWSLWEATSLLHVQKPALVKGPSLHQQFRVQADTKPLPFQPQESLCSRVSNLCYTCIHFMEHNLLKGIKLFFVGYKFLVYFLERI